VGRRRRKRGKSSGRVALLERPREACVRARSADEGQEEGMIFWLMGEKVDRRRSPTSLWGPSPVDRGAYFRQLCSDE